MQVCSTLPASFRKAHELDNQIFFSEVVGELAKDAPGAVREAIESLPAGERREKLLQELDQAK